MDQTNSNKMNSQIQPTDEYTTPPSIVQVHLHKLQLQHLIFIFPYKESRVPFDIEIYLRLNFLYIFAAQLQRV